MSLREVAHNLITDWQDSGSAEIFALVTDFLELEERITKALKEARGIFMGERRAIHIVTFQRGPEMILFAVCIDGSMWERNLTIQGGWLRMPDVPQELTK